MAESTYKAISVYRGFTIIQYYSNQSYGIEESPGVYLVSEAVAKRVIDTYFKNRKI